MVAAALEVADIFRHFGPAYRQAHAEVLSRADVVAYDRLVHPEVLLVAAIVLAVAILGKFAGVYLGARLTRLGHWEALALGAGMNARGAMEIIVATIGLTLGILTAKMYSIILLTAIATSLMAPPLLRWTIRRVEMGEEERRRLQAEDLRRESFVGNLKRVLLLTSGDTAAHLAARLVGLLLRGGRIEDLGVEAATGSLTRPVPILHDLSNTCGRGRIS